MSHRFTDTVRKHGTVRLRLWTLVVAVLAASAVGAAPVAAREPTGDFAPFAQCPRFTAGVEVCIYDTVLGGEMVLGRLAVPLQTPLTLQGGLSRDESVTPAKEAFFGALNGETLGRTPEPIPGGLLGRPLQATLELLESPNEILVSKENFENREGATFSLRTRIHLESSLLGHKCYIGSQSEPLTLNLTTGVTAPNAPNVPISGKIGIITAKDEFNFGEASNSVLVDNAFAVPAATGCGHGRSSPLVDGLIDALIGLPSPDGHNTLILDGTIKFATAEGVIASEAR